MRRSAVAENCPADEASVICHSCGRRVESTRRAAKLPRDYRHGHRGPICVRCWLELNISALRRGPTPVSAPGTPTNRMLTARQARVLLGVPEEALLAGRALGLIHPLYVGRPAGKRRRRDRPGQASEDAAFPLIGRTTLRPYVVVVAEGTGYPVP
jgi:hypothetical protein